MPNYKPYIEKTIKWLTLFLTGYALYYFANKIINEKELILKAFYELLSDHRVIILECILLCLNITLETLRWKTIYNNKQRRFSFYLSTTLKAIALGNSSFWGVGEHLARIKGEENKAEIALKSVAASFIQTYTIVAFGIIGIAHNLYRIDTRIIITVSVATAISAILIIKSRKTSKLLKALSDYNIAKALIINIFRYLTFSTQLLILLSCCNADLWYIYSDITFYYLLITLIPNTSIANIGIKGSVALYVFGSYMSHDLISCGIISIWIINTLTPSACGLFILIKEKFTNN